MTGYKWVRFTGSFASAALMSLLCIAGLVSKASSQSVEAAPDSGATSTFVAARSFAVSGTPTSVMTADLNRDGKLDLIVIDATSGKVTVFLGAGGGKFDSGTEYATGLHPDAMAIGDIDGDGRQDIVVADSTEGTVTAFYGDGNGKLQSKGSYHVGFDPAFVAAGDFNGAGRTDFAVLSKSGKVLATLMNDGHGSLVKSAPIALAKAATSLTVADFNHDGRADLALANADGTISTLLGNGDGSFRSAPEIHVSTGAISSIIVGDFNRDGKVDLAVTEADNRMVSVLLGKGDGGFSSAVHYPVGSHPVAAAVADFDEDGIPDLVVANRDSNTFSVLAGIGDGGFKASQDFIAGKEPVAVSAGDFAGNGHIDLAFLNASSRTVSVPLGNGDGTFQAARSYATEFRPRSIASGDLNGDGKPDLVVINSCGADAACAKGGSATVFLAGESGYKAASTYALGAGPVAVALADVNGDKILDIVALNRGDKTVSIQLGLGDGRFQQPFTFTEPDAPVAFAVGDLNHDGKPDLAVVGDCGSEKCSQKGSVDLLLGAGDGTFRSTHIYPVGYAPSSVAIGDVNRDGSSAIVVANRCGKDASCNSTGAASIFIADNDGRFQQGADLTLGSNPRSVALADLSGSGVSDLVVSHATDNAIAVYRSDGKGSFQAPISYAVGAGPRSVAVADFNGDGIADVAVSNYDDATVSVLFGRGDGTLQPAASFPVGAGPDGIVAIAGRGHSSLATANANAESATPGAEITVLENVHAEEGTGELTTKTKLSLTASVAVNAVNTLTATVSSSQTSAIPTGTVAFTATPTGTEASVTLTCSNASTAPSTVKLNKSGVAACQAQPLPAGSYSIKAHYSGDPNFAFSDANAAKLTVGQGTATGEISSLPAQASVAQPVSFTLVLTPATQAGATPAIAPTGNVTFTQGTTSLCTSPAVLSAVGTSASASATCPNYIFPKAITATITAAYSGDANFPKKSYTLSSYKVQPAATTTTPSSSLNPSTVDDEVTFEAVVAPVFQVQGGTLPTGTVTFTDLKMTLPCTKRPLSSGTNGVVATCGPVALTAGGKHTITATYNGDLNFSSSFGQLTQTVAAKAPTITVATLPNPSVTDQSVTLSAKVDPGSGSISTSPTGKVNFTYTLGAVKTILCSNSQTPTTKGTPTTFSCPVQLPTKGDYGIVAEYGGDDNFQPVSSAPAKQTVAQANTSVASFAVTPSTSSVDQIVAFTAVIKTQYRPIPAGSPLAYVPPSGTVTFKDASANNRILCSTTVDAITGAVHSCTGAFGGIKGSHNIEAVYSGDLNFFGSSLTTGQPPNTNAPSQNVQQATTSLTVTSSSKNRTSVATQSVTLTATVAPPTGNSYADITPPTGAVTFTLPNDALDSCTATPTSLPANGQPPYTATCAISFSSQLFTNTPVTVMAHYNGDSSFFGGDGSVNQTVQNFTPSSASGPANASPQPGYIPTITQGASSNTSDPFNPSSVTIKSTPFSGFSDALSISSCMVTAGPTGWTANSVTCVATPAPANSGAFSALKLTSNPPAPVGLYTLTVVASDTAVPKLTQLTTFQVNVVQVVSARVSSGGSSPVMIEIPDNVSVSALACGSTLRNLDNGGSSTLTDLGLSCSGFTTSSGSGNTVTFTVSKSATVAQNATSGHIALAAILGTPLFFLMGLVSRARNKRQSFLRFFGLCALIFAGLQTLSCGGGFNNQLNTTNTGTFDLQIVSMDAPNKSEGVVQLIIAH